MTDLNSNKSLGPLMIQVIASYVSLYYTFIQDDQEDSSDDVYMKQIVTQTDFIVQVGIFLSFNQNTITYFLIIKQHTCLTNLFRFPDNQINITDVILKTLIKLVNCMDRRILQELIHTAKTSHVSAQPGICLDHVWAMAGPYYGPAYAMSGPCLGHVRAIPGPSLARFGPCMAHV